jgi:hypothetical protein
MSGRGTPSRRAVGAPTSPALRERCDGVASPRCGRGVI